MIEFMEQYINKSALVAEINKLRKTSLEYGYTAMSKVLADTGKDLALGQLLHNLDTLEVKEVDEEPYVMSDKGKFTTTTK